MRIGINGSAVMTTSSSIDAVAEHARQADADGFPSYWVNQSSTGGGLDALTAIVVAARIAPTIAFGTAIIPTLPRHPIVMATQAITTQMLIGGRLSLGIGLSHKVTMEEGLGLRFERPIRHMREYLSILRPLLDEQKVSFSGELLSCHAELSPLTVPPCPIIVAALGPQMLRLTGRLADGTILWLVGPTTIREHIAPTIAGAAATAGRPAPQIIASLPICVTDDPESVRATISAILARYNELPFYRAMLDREGAELPGDVAVVGNEDAVREQLAAIAGSGATEFAALEFPAGPDAQERTRALLKAMAAGN